jgi:hypothetical protein
MNTPRSDYTQWDYTNGYLMADETRMGMYYLFKEGDIPKINNFLTWLKQEQSSFMCSHKDFIFTRLVEFKHFSVTDELCANKPYQFDEKIGKTCAGNLSLTFDCESFDYWNGFVKKLDETQQSTVFRAFWGEFLSYQIRPEDYEKGLKNLFYVFDKVPFYLDSKRELSNGYFIKERAECFDKSRLNIDQKNDLLKELGILCANKYPLAKELFVEEFAKHPAAIQSFNSVILHNQLDESLSSKKPGSKIKI